MRRHFRPPVLLIIGLVLFALSSLAYHRHGDIPQLNTIHKYIPQLAVRYEGNDESQVLGDAVQSVTTTALDFSNVELSTQLDNTTVLTTTTTKKTTTNSPEPLIVHYIHFQDNPLPLSFLDCISVVSVIKNLQPDFIYYHTNKPDFWPFDPCAKYVGEWPIIKVIPVHQRFMVNRKRIHFIHHEADVLRVENLSKYGGLALDFDVIVINGTALRAMLREHSCIMCEEAFPKMLNSGFFGCKRGARFAELMLAKYHTDFRPFEWVYNSGHMAYNFWQEDHALVHVVPEVCSYPVGYKEHERDVYLHRRGYYHWMEKLAIHTYLHGRDFGEEQALKMNSSFGDMVRWVMKGAPVFPPLKRDARDKWRPSDKKLLPELDDGAYF